MTVDETQVYDLYHFQKKSLRTIGKEFGLSGERIRQLMKQWGYPRRKGAAALKGRMKFSNLTEYLQYRRGLEKGAVGRTFYRLVKPYMTRCEKCGRTKRLHVKFLRKSILKREDFVILCSHCLFAPIRKGIDGNKAQEIFRRYLAGERTKNLAKEFEISEIGIYKMLQREGILRERRKHYANKK